MAGKPKKDPTPEEREARAARARENGRKGGRPPKSPWNAAQRRIAEARAKGEAALPSVVDYIIELAQGEHEDATHDHRLRAAEFLGNRCGLPVRTEQMIGSDVDKPLRVVNAIGWRDADGNLRALDGTILAEDGTAAEPE